KGPGDAEFKLLADSSDQQSQMSVSRSTAGPKAMSTVNPQFPVRYSFVDQEPTEGLYQYRVVPYDTESSSEGSQSVEVQVDATTGMLGANLVQAAFSTGIVEGTSPLSVGFDASNSFAIDADIVRYQWDFDGDGSIDLDNGDDPFAQYTYGGNERYNATLVVTSSNGDTASTTRAIAVRNAEGNLPPTVRFEMTDQTANRRIPDGENATLQGLLP